MVNAGAVFCFATALCFSSIFHSIFTKSGVSGYKKYIEQTLPIKVKMNFPIIYLHLYLDENFVIVLDIKGFINFAQIMKYAKFSSMLLLHVLPETHFKKQYKNNISVKSC